MSRRRGMPCPGCSRGSIAREGLCRDCLGLPRPAELAARRQARYRDRVRIGDQAVPGHRLIGADKAGARKAHCSCGWWSPDALSTAGERRRAHAVHARPAAARRLAS